MSLAAFLGGGKDQKGQGIFGRANAVAEEDREQQNKLQQIALEQQLKNAGSTDMPFNLSVGNPADPKNPLSFNYAVNPLYLKDDQQMRVQAENLMNKWSQQPDKIKELQWNNRETRTQLESVINIIRSQSYKKKYNNDTGALTSYEGVSNQPFYADTWSYENIWKKEDENNMNFKTERITSDSFLESMDITPPPGVDSSVNTATSTRFDPSTSQIIYNNTSTFVDIADTFKDGNAPTATQVDKLVDVYSTDNDYMFNNDFDGIIDSIGSTITAKATRDLGGNTYASGYDPQEENRTYKAIFENQQAVDNGILTGLEMTKLAVGFRDPITGEVQEPLAVLGSTLDIVTGINNLVSSIKGAADFLTNQTNLMDSSGFISGKKTEAGRTNKTRQDFLKQKYDGLEIGEFRKHGLSGEHIKDKQLRSMYRYKALQIHLTFQLAIAMQGFQGGKAVSDADFDRAWMLLTGNAGKTVFGKLSSPTAVKEGLQVVTEQFGRFAVYNKAYLRAKPGTRKEVATLALNIFDAKALREGTNTGDFASKTIYRKEMEGIQFDDLETFGEDLEMGEYFEDDGGQVIGFFGGSSQADFGGDDG